MAFTICNFLLRHRIHGNNGFALRSFPFRFRAFGLTIARAFDFIKMMKKVPIIVKDSWGFFSGRVRNTYILEGISLLQEGFTSAFIENLGVQTGMKTGPLSWADDLSLDLIQEYERQAAELYGPKYVRHPARSEERRVGKEC